MAELIAGRTDGSMDTLRWERFTQTLFCLKFRGGYHTSDNDDFYFLDEIGDALQSTINFRQFDINRLAVRSLVAKRLDSVLADAHASVAAHFCLWAANGPASFPEHTLSAFREEVERSRRSSLAVDLAAVAAIFAAEIHYD